MQWPGLTIAHQLGWAMGVGKQQWQLRQGPILHAQKSCF